MWVRFTPGLAAALPFAALLTLAAEPPAFRVSPRIQEWKLIKWVPPNYPLLARKYRDVPFRLGRRDGRVEQPAPKTRKT